MSRSIRSIPAKFTEITRRGRLDQVLDGLAAAKRAGLAVKINTVALRGVNEDELDDLVAWCGDEGFDLVIIEVMPMGDIGGENRLDQYLPLSVVRARLQRRWTLDETDYRTGGPARYVTVRETGRRLGFITPLTHNFCESCNRVRLTCTGTLYMCLGQEDAADLRTPLRQSEGDEAVEAAIREAIARKPKGHDFIIDRRHNRPAGVPPYERHRRVTAALFDPRAAPRVAFVASEAEAAQLALRELRRHYGDGRPGGGRRHRAARRRRVHARNAAPLCRHRQADLRHASRQRRVPDELVPARGPARTPRGGAAGRTASARNDRALRARHGACSAIAFNEVSLLRETRQAAKLRVSVDGVVRLDELMADGILLVDPGRQHRL